MTKVEFVLALNNKLSLLSKADREAAIHFYVEIIDDKMDQGMSESEAINSLGDIDTLAKNILKERSENMGEDIKSIARNVLNQSKKEYHEARKNFNNSSDSTKVLVIIIIAIILLTVLRRLRGFLPLVVIGLVLYILFSKRKEKDVPRIEEGRDR